MAKRAGDLVAKPCEVCGSRPSVAHHDDYAKPLDVRWLCRSCHGRWHAEHGSAANRDISGLPPGAAKCGMTRKERIRVAAEADVDPRTVARWLKDPASVHAAIGATLGVACAKLGLKVVPAPGTEAAS